MYGYVKNPNAWIDVFGLDCENKKEREIIIDDKIRRQMEERGWSEEEMRLLANSDATGASIDRRRPNKTSDGLGRNDTASVFGNDTTYIVVNDRTNEVVQISDKNDTNWIADSRINWFDKS